MAKQKTTQKKTATSTKAAGSKSIFSFLLVPMAVVAIAIAACAYILVTMQANAANSKHQNALISNIANQYEAYVNNVIDQQDALMTQIARSETIIELVSEGDEAELLEAEAIIASQIPNGLSVHVYPLRGAIENNNTTPPLSFAGLDMIRRAEQGQRLAIEAHQYNGEAYLQSVRAVRGITGQIIGTVSVAQSLDYLGTQLGGIDASMGNLIIQQKFNQAPLQTLVTYGVKNNNEVIQLKTSNPYWILTFQPADELAQATVMSANIIWMIFAVLALACLLPIILSGQQLQAALRQDANAFAKQIQSVLAGQATADANFKLAIFSTLAKTVNRMRMGKVGSSARGKKAPERNTQPSLAKAAEAEEVDTFDVPMMDSDSDLLGMNTTQIKPQHVNVDESIFKPYDIRGVVGQTLNKEDAHQIGLAIGSEAYDRGEQTVVVARDGRLSSADLTQALIKGLTASGRDVIDIGVVPTPVCYFACEHLNVSSCVMVTGSHNAANYNGFKIVISGSSLLDDEIKGLYHRIENQNFLAGHGKTTTQDVSGAYLSRVSQDVKAKRPLKVVIDCGNGVAGNVAPALVKAIGCHVLPLYCDLDGNFPNHLPNPNDPKNLQDLTRTVVETRADLGLAFDGDGDRLGIVTNGGKILFADRLLMLLAKDVLRNKPGSTVLFDVKSSKRLKNLVLGFGGKPVMWKTGHSFMKRKMKETGAALAGEMSGHIFYQDRWYGFDDALYAAARLIEMLAGQDENLDTLLSELPQDISTPEINIGTSDDRKFRIIESLQRNGQFAGGQLTDIDGVRVDFQEGWGLVRASNTSPRLTCRFEAETEQSLRKIQNLFKQQLLAVDSQLQIPF